MVKLFKVVVLMGTMLAASLVGAQGAAPQGRVAVLNLDAAIYGTEEAQKRLKALDTQPDYDANKKQFDKLKKEYEDMVKQLQKDGAVMSQEQQMAQRKKLETKSSDLEHIRRKLMDAQQDVMQRVMQEMEPKLSKVLKELIKSENIGLLLDARSAMHSDPGFNITSKVTEQLNKAN